MDAPLAPPDTSLRLPRSWLNTGRDGEAYWPTVADYLAELRESVIEYQRKARRRQRLTFDEARDLRRLLACLADAEICHERLSTDDRITLKDTGGRLRQSLAELATLEGLDPAPLLAEAGKLFSPAWCGMLRLTLSKQDEYGARGMFLDATQAAHYFTAKVRSGGRLTPNEVDQLHDVVKSRFAFRAHLDEPEYVGYREDVFVFRVLHMEFDAAYRRIGRVVPILSMRYALHPGREWSSGMDMWSHCGSDPLGKRWQDVYWDGFWHEFRQRAGKAMKKSERQQQSAITLHPCDVWFNPIISAIDNFPTLNADDLPDALEPHHPQNPYRLLVEHVRGGGNRNRLERLREWLQVNASQSVADEVKQRVTCFLDQAEQWVGIAHYHASDSLRCEQLKYDGIRLTLADWLGGVGSDEPAIRDLLLKIQEEGNELTEYLRHLSAMYRTKIAKANTTAPVTPITAWTLPQVIEAIKSIRKLAEELQRPLREASVRNYAGKLGGILSPGPTSDHVLAAAQHILTEDGRNRLADVLRWTACLYKEGRGMAIGPTIHVKQPINPEQVRADAGSLAISCDDLLAILEPDQMAKVSTPSDNPPGKGALEKMKLVKADAPAPGSGPAGNPGVSIANWADGGLAFANAFTGLLAALAQQTQDKGNGNMGNANTAHTPAAVADQIERMITDAGNWMEPRPGIWHLEDPIPDYMIRESEEAAKQRESAIMAGKILTVELVRLGESASAALTLLNALESDDLLQARKDWPAVKVSLQEAAIRLRLRDNTAHVGTPTVNPVDDDAPAPTPAPPVPKSAGERQAEWLAKAMLMVQDHPDWSDAEIARRIGKNAGTLSRNNKYKMAAKLARGSKTDRPKGYVTVDPDSGAADVEGVAPPTVPADDRSDQGKLIPGSRYFREYCAECREPMKVTPDKVGTKPLCDACKG